MADAPVTVTLDATRLTEALRRLQAASHKSAADLINKKCYWIVAKALWSTKKTPAEQIASELNATIQVTRRTKTRTEKTWVNKRGRVVTRKGGTFMTSKKVVSFGQGPKGAPVLALILQSRVKNSGRNLGYAAKPPWHESKQIPQSPWKGVNRATGASRMLAAMRKMYGMKVSSRAYLASGWLEALNAFKKAMSGALLKEGKKAPSAGEVKRYGKQKGTARTASAGPKAEGVFVNAAWSNDDGGRALVRIGAPALQAAMDSEAGYTMQKAMELEYLNACKVSGVDAKIT